MLRENGKRDFRLHIESRFSSPTTLGAKLVASSEGLTYVPLDDTKPSGEAEATTRSTDHRLLTALRDVVGTGLTYGQIGAIPGLSQDQARKRFPGWYREQKIDRNGSGKKGDPYRWFALST
jgi:hypothetical protein